MTDYELMQMELEKLNKNLDLMERRITIYKAILKQKSKYQAEELALLTDKLKTQIKQQNSDTELYGKNSFAATLSRQLVNAWVFAIENYGCKIKFDFKGDLISDMWLYSGINGTVLHLRW